MMESCCNQSAGDWTAVERSRSGGADSSGG